MRGALLAVVLVATFGAGIGVGRIDLSGPSAPPNGAPTGAGPSGSATPEQEFDLIRQAWDDIHQNYVAASTLDDRALAYGAIDGLTEAVGDTGHTAFLTPEDRAANSSALSGSYVGIGVEVDTTDAGLPLIVGVFRGSPADAAGLHSGDVVTAVDDRPTTGEDLDTVVSWVRGEAGTAVTLTIQPADGGKIRDVRIVRADVKIEPVSWSMVAGTTTGMIRLEQFSTGAAAELRAAIGELKAAGADRLVFDLRGNPGGYVNEAVAVASEFLSSGTVYIERNAKGGEKASNVKPGGTATDIPLVVLVDGGTASAAEIVAGAIQDAGRAKIVGEQTFGTGTVLGEFPLSDGSALRIGTVEWLTPKGRVIWHAGIAPDVVVERAADLTPIVPDDLRTMSAAEVRSLRDPQVKKALELVVIAS
ncbi:MAG TPA: S41 family peptidase [Candidatus Limnocylindrales bacterium]|nr:S41 family peptidase [Candidatus Limnocylindrales bacterium]